MIPPVVWIPAGFALGLALALYGGMSMAYDRGRRHQREEAEADRAARAFRQLPGVPAHIPPLPAAAAPELVSWAEHERQALEVANARPVPPPLIVSEDPESLAYWRSLDRHPSGPVPAWSGPRGHYGPVRQALDDLSDSGFTRSMRDEVARGMAMVERILAGGEP
jgi:hypothetical protein